MNIQLKTEPFEHIIIENTFNDEQWYGITHELKNIYQNDLFAKEDTVPATDEQGRSLKNNKSVFLQNLKNYESSSLYASQYEIFGNVREWIENIYIDKKHWFLYNFRKNYKVVSDISGLISYYGNCDSYDGHIDNATLSCLTWYYREPKKFTGGELVFPDFDNYSIQCKNNYSVIFPSFIKHKVNKVEVEEEGYGRFTITNFWAGF